LAASRNASNTAANSRTTATTKNAPNIANGRMSFAKIAEPIEVPDLLALQADSFDWLRGSESWQARVEQAQSDGRDDVSTRSGLEEIFEEISPIEDFSGTMSLSFRDHRFEPPKNTVEECKERDFTYSAPLFVTAEFMNNETGEIKSQTVFMGDFPLMTDKGTFIVNGTERVVVSQLVRSPGVYFERSIDKTSDKDVFSAKMIPSRGAWLEFEIDKRDMVGVRLDRKRKQNVTVLLKALEAIAEKTGESYSYEETMTELRQFESINLTEEKDHTAGQDDALLDIYRKLVQESPRPARPRRRCWRTTTSTRSATTSPRSAATRSTRSSARTSRSTSRRSRSPTSSPRFVTSWRCTTGRTSCRRRVARSSSSPTTSTTSATVGCAPSES
jgi:DNA-directed RNA polymerase subunit beta